MWLLLSHQINLMMILRRFMLKSVKLSLLTSVVFIALVSGAASAQAATGPFTGTELDGAKAVVIGFLAVAAFIAIAVAVYRMGKRGMGS
jgi:hypothetical protein